MTDSQDCSSGGGVPSVKQRLAKLGLKPLKQFGQNFLTSPSVLRDIVAAAGLEKDDAVIEVGPGLGILTEELVKAAGRVVAVEVDAGLADALKKSMPYPNLTIVEGDILAVSPEEVLHQGGMEAATPYKVVANLPYNITSPVIRCFLEARRRPGVMVVMVQKEVGQAIAAAPGEMGLLAVTVQFYARPSIVRTVSAGCFYPAPKVDSVLLRLDLLPEPAVKVSDTQAFFDFVKCGFSAPRKQLRNPLARCLVMDPAKVAALLFEAGISPARRAETVSLTEWSIMYARFASDADYQSARQTKPGPRGRGQASGRLS